MVIKRIMILLTNNYKPITQYHNIIEVHWAQHKTEMKFIVETDFGKHIVSH